MTDRRSTALRSLPDSWIAAPLLAAGVCTRDQVDRACADGVAELWATAVAQGWAGSDRIVSVLAAWSDLPIADLERIGHRATALIPESLARKHRILPVSADDRHIVVATADPRDLDVERDLAFHTGRAVSFQLAAPEALLRRIDELYRPERSIERLLSGLGSGTVEPVVEAAAPGDGKDPILEAPVAKLVDALIAEGVRERASDIHFDPDDGTMVVRYRVDGVLREAMHLPRSAGATVVRRVKILANLDVTNPLVTADGRASVRVDGKMVDLRVATAPVARRGQKAVIRILDPSNLKTQLADLGLIPSEHEALTRLLGHREGIVLVTGPTGSGKTTTLYAALNQLRTGKVNIVTVEDPVEYWLGGVSQIQVNEAQGLTFAGILRSVLRQDPDIVLVGEIRDPETTTTAVQAGLTGHLVLSTLHTNDAPTAVIRLRDLGLDPFKAAAVLKGVVAQRLVRRLCDQCAAPADIDTVPATFRPPPGHPRPIALRRAVGCRTCMGTGYLGRLPVVEVLPVTGEVARVIGNGDPPAELHAAARAAGMRSMWESGLERVWDGVTTIAELERVLGEHRPVAAASIVREPGLTPAWSPTRLLIAAADGPSRLSLRTLLEREGCVVSEATHGLDALAQSARTSFDLIVLDLDMDTLDGLGVLEALRAGDATVCVPVILLTERAESESAAFDLGADDVVVKPFESSAFRARVRGVLRRAKG
ncbi:MAG: ATPase, T2SS/T4P/T4SS family [Gemmatimonadales bacterium]